MMTDQYQNAEASCLLPEKEVEQLPGLVTVGEGCRDVVSRALSRVPHFDRLAISSEAAFLVADPVRDVYLSEAFLQGRGVIVLGPEILSRSEEEQVETVLAVAAYVVLEARRPEGLTGPECDPIKLDQGAGELALSWLAA